MPASRQDTLRFLPSVDALLQETELQDCLARLPRQIVVQAVRAAVSEARQRLLAGTQCGTTPDAVRGSVIARVLEITRTAAGPHYRRAINATGIILHTGLGRAVLAKAALDQVRRELQGYSVLQIDTESGQRSRRDERIEWLLRQLTGAEAATVVNNNAAATMIVLSTLAKGREVIVSRGQLVEIGGSFRLPEVMAASGARLIEVGTTNKTHARDYESAITPETAAIMRVHPSNYRIQGFTAEVPLADLERIAHDHGLVLIDDLGAGALIDFARFGFEPEPRLADSVATGADIVTCSADKLIGAAQGGIILGKVELITQVRKNPLARAVRVDKVTLAIMEATLALFLDEQRALREVPTLAMLMREPTDVAAQADRIALALAARLPEAKVTTEAGFSQMGSGSLPEQKLATTVVAIVPVRMEAGELARRMRLGQPPVFARTHAGRVLIDSRTLFADDEQPLIETVIAACRA
ncbi:MAG TPA: L-seryl-tRNA(Sec) selenium transferase [Phycisphaerae bacterium]|nr:L-seryl-tRNA(Sec) selenium transferase [Phycisphaerae bacterium]HRY67202.1 L-seryl-tRNA(Sec) selenium transferase [Phycisphaerae bacterium]HSA26428.1 L-seryl-tRNA(Sec) selenium transferase [Phycisphaerae bacterium]